MIQLLTYRGGGRTENREGGNETIGVESQEGRNSKVTYRRLWPQKDQELRSDSKMDIVAGEAGPSEFQSRYKKGHMKNIYLTDSDEEAIMDFATDHEELFDKNNKHFKDKARKDCLWDRFTSSHNF